MKCYLLFLTFCVLVSADISQAGQRMATISGISSGAFMAVQMGVAYSERFSGVGSIAGGIYGCARGQAFLATQECMKNPDVLDVSFFTLQTRSLAAYGQIDSVENLKKQKIYIFSSSGDSVVNQAAGEKLKSYYQDFIPTEQIFLTASPQAAHGFPTLNEGGPCQQAALPWILNCKFDAAGEIFKHLYGKLKPRGTAKSENLVKFNQNVFGGALASLESEGWVYFPENCRKDLTCKLHVALHGCQMNSEFIQDQFVKTAGYNEWAESNDIVVLYPQAAKNILNPQACWDWYGYTGVNYATKSGAQMSALMRMIQQAP